MCNGRLFVLVFACVCAAQARCLYSNGGPYPVSTLSPLYRRFRRSAWMIPLLALLGVVAVNLLCLFGARLLASYGFWQENKVWKGLLLDVQSPPPDVVIVGSSRTLNQFDTVLMNRSGMRFFNFGIPEVLPDEMPGVLERAARRAQRTVVIPVPAQFLFSAPSCPRMWTWDDLRFYAFHAPQCVGSLSLSDWFGLLPINTLFTAVTPDIRALPCRRAGLADELARLGAVLGGNPCDDPRRPMLLRGNAQRSVVVYANGDGVIVSTSTTDWQQQVVWRDRRDEAYDSERVAQLRNLIAIVRGHGKEPVLLIEPDPVEHSLIRQDLGALLGVRTLYLNEWTFGNDEIADLHHLNRKGGVRVSQYVANELLP